MTTIADLAHELADKFGDTYDEALTTVTTYASQMDIPNLFEGGQAPNVEIDPETADHIYRAYEAGSELA